MDGAGFGGLWKIVVPEFVFGIGARDLAGQYAANIGIDNALVVSDPGVIEAGWTGSVVKSLQEHGVSTSVFSQVSENPRDHQIHAGASFFKENSCNGIVAVGGGSPMDCAKGIGIINSNGGEIKDYEGVDKVEEPCVPMIFIPTTSGSSADVSQFAIITDTQESYKFAIISKTVVPDVSLIDPETLTTMDEELTINTCLDALTHSVESLVSNAHSPVTESMSLAAIRLIFDNLPEYLNDKGNLVIRERLAEASLRAGIAFSNASLGIVHSMAHAMGGLKDSPHGLCNAILMPLVLDYNFAEAEAQLRKMAKVLEIKAAEDSDTFKSQLMAAFNQLYKTLNMEVSISRLGVKKEDIRQLAEFAANDPCTLTNPRVPTLEDIEAIYAKAL